MYLKAAPEVILVTDHNPLQWLRKQKDPRHTFARWLMKLEEIPYVIRNRPGIQNQLPDYLSRRSYLEVDKSVNCEEQFEEKIYCVDSPEGWMRKMRAEQDKDALIQEAIEQILKVGRVWKGQFRGISPSLEIKDGLLYFGARIVVPKSLQLATLQRVNSEMHSGQERTLQLMRKSYFWVGLARDVRSQCRTCVICQRAKPTRKPKEQLGSAEYGNAQPG